jgi:hypothetical protein
MSPWDEPKPKHRADGLEIGIEKSIETIESRESAALGMTPPSHPILA